MRQGAGKVLARRTRQALERSILAIGRLSSVGRETECCSRCVRRRTPRNQPNRSLSPARPEMKVLSGIRENKKRERGRLGERAREKFVPRYQLTTSTFHAALLCETRDLRVQICGIHIGITRTAQHGDRRRLLFAACPSSETRLHQAR